MSNTAKYKKILTKLESTWPEAHCELNHETPYQLLIATILSAQCTDKRVNQITPVLFKKAPNAKKMLALGIEGIASLIKSCGFYNTKAKNIYKTSEILLQTYDGQVPNDFTALCQLPSVGRKTANVVMSNAFGVPAFAVDTHVYRLAHRLGFSTGKTPEQVEADLCRIVPKKDWTATHHRLIFHGRYHCLARNPKCETCPLTKDCTYYQCLIKK